MSDLVATALGLAFTLIVCLLALHALVSPWLRLRRAPTATARRSAEKHSTEKHAVHAPHQHKSTPVHTA